MDYSYRPDNFEDLQRWVEQAFADAVYPGDDSIATNPDHCEECSETDAFFRGKHWRTLVASGQRLQFGWGGLSFLSPKAWRFYMPAYLLVGLSESEYAVDSSWSALFALSPPQSADLEEYFRERASSFSLAQQECIAAYASAFSAMEPDDETYKTAARYWQEKVAATNGERDI